MSVKEYPVKIHLKSKISSLLFDDTTRPLVVEDEDGELALVGNTPAVADTVSEEAECDIIEAVTDGVLSVEGDSFTVSYTESEESGMGGSTTKICFERELPEVITMVRCGQVSSAMLFDPSDARRICTYDTGIMPIELAVNTKRVKNSITERGGDVLLEYTVEMRGMQTQRTLMEFSVVRDKRQPAEALS